MNTTLKFPLNLKNPEATIILETMTVNVVMTHGRISWGTKHILITPISGQGSKWVTLDRLQLTDSQRKELY